MQGSRFGYHSRSRALRIVGTALALACAPALQAALPASASGDYDLHAAARDTSGPRRVCQDFFCNVSIVIPPEQDVDNQADRMSVVFSPQVVSPSSTSTIAAFAESGGGAASGSAVAKMSIDSDTVKFGVSASAAKSSVFVGEARAELRTEYSVLVELHTGDLLGALTAGACATGCPLAIDFLHQTTGRFAYTATPGASARASFAEVLSIDGIVRASGEAFIAANPASGTLLSPGAGGDWSSSDFLSVTTGAAGAEWTFNHFAEITDQIAMFHPGRIDENNELVFQARYLITVEQVAEADFGTFEYIVGSATLAADFDDTSTFTVGALHDPSGVLDLSGARVSVSFQAASVPLPAPLGLLGGALAGLWGARRRRA